MRPQDACTSRRDKLTILAPRVNPRRCLGIASFLWFVEFRSVKIENESNSMV